MTSTCKGSGIGIYREGERVTLVTQVQTDDLLAEHSVQFDALNLIRVTRVADDGSRFHARHVDPLNPTQPRRFSTGEFCVWDFQIGGTYLLHRVSSPASAT